MTHILSMVVKHGLTKIYFFRWIAYELEERMPHSDTLLKHVRMGLLTNDSFFRILNYHKLTAASPAVHTVLLQASIRQAEHEVFYCILTNVKWQTLLVNDSINLNFQRIWTKDIIIKPVDLLFILSSIPGCVTLIVEF